MCYSCWERAGKPAVITPAVLAAAPLIAEADEFGALHIVVSDWNVEDSNIVFCLGLENITDEEITLAKMLQGMSYDERYSAMVLAEGIIDEAGNEREVR